MALPINKVTNANVYAEGNSLLGKVMEFELPELSTKTTENNPLGMIGVTEHFAGFEKMEGVIKWQSFYKEVFDLTGDPFASKSLQLRANIDVYDSSGFTQVAAVVYLTCQFKKVPFGSFKAHENVELETDISVTAIKMEYDGATVLEYDALANIYKLNGVDKLATYRNNIGA
jgi:P2 family phage contractile tail tube protein